MECVYCAVRTVSLDIFQFFFLLYECKHKKKLSRSNSRFRYHSGKKFQSKEFQIHFPTKHTHTQIYIYIYRERERERERERATMMTNAENLFGTRSILAPNWIRVKIVTCNNLTILVQCGKVSVGMDATMRHTYFNLKI